MILLVGPSASGKTEVAKQLNKQYGIAKAVTTTSRAPRDGEINGVDYFFVTKEEFLNLKSQDLFVETTIYNENYYGCGKNQITDNKAVILDPNGLESFQKLNNNHIISFFINASEETRKKRMISRGDKLDKVEARLLTDKTVFANITNTDFIIKNENKTLSEITTEIYNLYTNKLKSL